jgi:hypothetical protein
MRALVRILVCLGIAAALIWSTLAWQSAFESHQAGFGPVLDLPGAEKSIFFDPDSYMWMSYAQRMAATGEWRIRHTALDNAPFGREVHWSQSITWLAALAGRIRAALTGEAWIDAIPLAAIWLNPSILFVSLCFLFCALERRLGVLPALLAVAWMLSLFDLVSVFQPYRPDHESLHLGLFLTGALSLLCGGVGFTSDAPRDPALRWVALWTPPTLRSARRWFAAAGVAGGCGLWVGATPQAIGLAIAGVGLFAGAVLLKRDREQAGRFAPELFRVWARAGAATSLLLYALEYQPGPIAWRLEVNHPLFALTWLAGAELLVLAYRARSDARALATSDWIRGAVCALGALALPAALAFGGAPVHALRDPEMLRAHEYISEFRSYFEVMPEGFFAENYLLLPLCLPAALALLFAQRLDSAQRQVIWLACALALGFGALLFHAQRWADYYAVASVVLMAFTVAAGVSALRGVHRALALVEIAALFAGAAFHLTEARAARITELASGSVLDMDIAQRVMLKRFAVQLASRIDPRDARLMVGEPGMGPVLAYFGGFSSTTTLYWENLDGLRAASAFFDAASDDEALRIAASRGLTHVVMPLVGDMPRLFHRVRSGADEDAPFSNLGSRLMKGEDLPPWLLRESALDGIESCWFGGYQLGYPIGVWRIVLPRAIDPRADRI